MLDPYEWPKTGYPQSELPLLYFYLNVGIVKSQ
jgi:hypothetical protein